jgi:LacI family transcriptional regulator
LRDDSEFWNWLKAAPKPLGLFAVDDSLAVEATQTCRGLGLHVPDEIAILGADDNALLCHIADPRLSSVKTPLFQSGFDAATLLDSMFAPHASQCQTRVMDPIHVTNGASSGVLAVDDSAISEILRRIHSAGGTPLTVKALLKDLSFSRRALEKRFRAAVGCSPMEEVRRVREAQVVQMLLHSDTPIWQVAKECGFGSAVHLSVAFKRSQGLSPREFREQFRRLRKFPLETAGHPRATPSKTKCTNPAVDRPRSTKATVPR